MRTGPSKQCSLTITSNYYGAVALRCGGPFSEVDMRLRHNPKADIAVENSEYVEQDPKARKGHWHDLFGNDKSGIIGYICHCGTDGGINALYLDSIHL